MTVEFISGVSFNSTIAVSGSQGSVTVPTDCTAIVVAASVENVATSGGKKLTALNWDGGGYDFGTDFIGAGGDTYSNSGVELAVMTADATGWPGTGSGKTLYWTHVDVPTIETKFWVGFFKGVDQTTPLNITTWTDTNDDNNSGVAHTSALGTLASGDYGIMASYYWEGTPATTNTELHDSASGAGVQSLFIAGDVDDTSIAVTGLDYPITCAFSLKTAPVSGSIVPHAADHYRRRL